MNINRVVRAILPLLIALSVSSCAPRGETRSLAEILSGSQARFAASYKGAGLSADAQKDLDGLTAALKDLLKSRNGTGTGTDTAAVKVVEQMSQLAKSAGYTSRPAFFELLKQYEMIARGRQGQSKVAGSPQVTLLAARTYNLLARELETTRFKL
jgi:uncharacterized lipoprotein YehR (DUF1307 family)